jgi:hypothetical protein
LRYEELYQEIAHGSAAGSLPGWALGVLHDITEGRRRVTAVRHPLGFLCLPIERRNSPTGRLGVCLHLWSPWLARATATTSLVHCHSWDLISFVLYGEVRNVPARIQDTADGATHRVFEVFSHGDTDEIVATGRTVGYRPGAAREHHGGEVYSLPAGVFHSTEIGGDLNAATVALGHQTRPGEDRSLGDLDTPTHHVRRMRCGPLETTRAALLTAERLAAAHAA